MEIHFFYSQSYSQPTFVINTHAGYEWSFILHFIHLSHTYACPLKCQLFYFSHETTTLITKCSQWPRVDSKHKSVRFRLMINVPWTPLHYQISDLLSHSHPTDPVISQSGMPSLSVSSWPVPPPPFNNHVPGMPDPSCAWQRGGQKINKGVHACLVPYCQWSTSHMLCIFLIGS